MEKIIYDLKRHVELLNVEKDILSQHKSFYNEKPTEFFELLKYDIIIERDIFWEERFKVQSLLESFLNKEIDPYEFHDSVFGLHRLHLEKCKKFRSKLFSGEITEYVPNKESYKLKGFLESLYGVCEHFEMDWNEKEFYDTIENGFLKFQKVLE